MGISTDVSSQESIKAAFEQIKKEFAPDGELKLAAAVFNLASGFVRKPFLELTAQEFDNGYHMNA